MATKTDTRFRAWMFEVDRHMMSIAGLSYLDLPDQEWREWYEDEVSSQQAAVWALENEGFYAERFA